jgi:hypothetical protein
MCAASSQPAGQNLLRLGFILETRRLKGRRPELEPEPVHYE